MLLPDEHPERVRMHAMLFECSKVSMPGDARFERFRSDRIRPTN